MGLKEPTCFSSRVQIFLKTAKINKLCLNILFGFTLYEYIYVIRVFFFSFTTFEGVLS